MRTDSADIAERVRASIEAVLDTLNPGWVEHKGRAYLSSKGPKQLGSFVVNLQGDKRGAWYRFSRRVGGGPIALIGYLLTGNEKPGKSELKTAFDWARGFLGITETQEPDDVRKAREARQAHDARQRALRKAAEAVKKAKRATTAAGIFAECLPIAGTHAEAYLLARRIPPVETWPWSPDGVLGFHPSLAYDVDGDFGEEYPALVANVQDCFGDTTAIWRIYLDRTNPVKAPVRVAKVGFGPAGGGAVRLGGDGPHIGVAEGIESALSTWTLERWRIPVWATLSTSGMAAFEPPLDVDRISIFPDGDRAVMDRNGRVFEPPGLHAGKQLMERIRLANIRGVINEPAMNADANDFLMADW